MALFGRDPDDDEAMAGALLLADGLGCWREVRALVRGLAQGSRRRG
jgi:hypothetical protein